MKDYFFSNTYAIDPDKIAKSKWLNKLAPITRNEYFNSSESLIVIIIDIIIQIKIQKRIKPINFFI